MPSEATAWALGSLLVAVLFVVARERGWTEGPAAGMLLGLARMGSGALVWLVAGEVISLDPLAAPLPLLWTALMAPVRETDPERERGKVLLVAVATLQALHAFPVAGSQVAFASFLFVPVAGVAIAEGARGVTRSVAESTLSRRVTVRVLLSAAVLVLAVRPVYDLGRRAGSAYRTGVPLDLPGAESIRVTPRQASLYHRLTESITTRCRTLLTMPPLCSLYLFSRLEPPPMMYATAWLTTLDRTTQAEIAQTWSRLPSPMCAVEWRSPAEHPTPLTRLFDEGFETVYQVGDHRFMVRPGDGARVNDTP
jgi:hypothetical protein